MRGARCEFDGRLLVQVSQNLGGAWVCPDCLLKTARSLAEEVNGQARYVNSLKESLHAARQECHDLERRLERLKEKIASQCEDCGLDSSYHSSDCPALNSEVTL